MAENPKRKRPPLLKDLPQTPGPALDKLAALAPVPPPPEPKKQHEPRGDPGESTLGKVQVDKYLEHYQVPFTVKEIPASEQKPGRKVYVLQSGCLFDPENHRGKDASVVQLTTGPDAGKIFYQCFHNSCHGKHFSGPGGAREIISKDASLAPFMEGFDPEKHALRKRAEEDEEGGKSGVPAWLHVSEKGSVKFNPAPFANWVERQMAPLVHEYKKHGDQFWRYNQKRGVWQALDNSEILHLMRMKLGDTAKPAWITGALELLEEQCYVPPEKFEPDLLWINLRNGMLHLETRELRPHAKEFMSKIQLPISYKPDAKCPLWIKTAMEIYDDNPELVLWLQEFAGYILYPKVIFPAALFQVGGGSNGKGTVEDVLCRLVGKENCCHISLARMEDRFGPAGLRNMLLNTASETETRSIEVARFKQVSAGDRIQAEVKNEEDVIFQPYAKHVFSSNNFPRVKDRTAAFFRRVYIIQYKRKFENDGDDPDRKEKLQAELDGIFNWAFEGLQRVLERKRLRSVEEMEKSKRVYQSKINSALAFVDECCELQPYQDTLPKALYKAYGTWCEESKIQAMTKQNFYEQIELNFPKVKYHRVDTKWIYSGIGLLSEEDHR